MTERVAILGLGTRGIRWADTCLAAGWAVSGFDPDDRAGVSFGDSAAWQRATTISGAVQGATWVICCLPERLDLMRTVVQRAQALATKEAVIAVASAQHNLEAVQGCAIRPGQVFRLVEGVAGDLALDVSNCNSAELRQQATEALAVLSAAQCVTPAASGMTETVPETRNA